MFKNKLFQCYLITILLLLILGTSFVQLRQLDWPVGEPFIVTTNYDYDLTQINLLYDISLNTHEIYTLETFYNITEINEEEEIVKYTTVNYNNFTYSTTLIYDVDILCSNWLSMDYFYNFNYAYDYDLDKPVLTSFSFDLYDYLLIEPNWTIVNDYFQNLFDVTYIIDTVVDGYTYTTYNIKLGDFYDGIVFSIMGKDNLDDAIDQFSGNTHKWVFQLDLSNYIYDINYNTTTWNYYYTPYSLFIQTVELEYYDTGILKNYKSSTRISYEEAGYIVDYSYSYETYTNIEKTGIFGFSYTSTISFFIILPIIVHIIKQKRKA